MNESEIKTLWAVLDTEGTVVSALYRFLLATGQRAGETRMAEWVQIEGDPWSIPAENTKADRSHTVPLSNLALSILEPLRGLDSPCVFPSPSPMGRGPIRYLGKTTSRLRRKCRFEFRVHDLRRTAATMLAQLGTIEETLRKLLNHKSGSTGVTAIYDRADRGEDVRDVLEKWGAKLERTVGG